MRYLSILALVLLTGCGASGGDTTCTQFVTINITPKQFDQMTASGEQPVITATNESTNGDISYTAEVCKDSHDPTIIDTTSDSNNTTGDTTTGDTNVNQ